MVSGTISLSSSECFSPFPHGTRSLSVSREYLALPDGPGGFAQDSTCPALLRIPLGPVCIRVRDCHPLRCNFPDASTLHSGATPWSYYPACASPRKRFGLLPVRSPLLGESLLFSLPGGTKMFQFPPFASAPHTCGWPPFRRPGCPIRRPAGQRSFAPHRGLSQLIASFIASVSQGIRHAPFPTSCITLPAPKGAAAHTSAVSCETVCPLAAAIYKIQGAARQTIRASPRGRHSLACAKMSKIDVIGRLDDLRTDGWEP